MKFHAKQKWHSFSLSEHMLRKDSIAIMKKFDFEILTYLYIFQVS